MDEKRRVRLGFKRVTGRVNDLQRNWEELR